MSIQSLPPAQPRAPDMPRVQRRFGYLHFVGYLLRIVAILALVFGVILAVTAFTASSSYTIAGTTFTRNPAAEAATSGLSGIGIFLGFFALAQFIDLQLAKEENQRITNELLYRLIVRRREQ